MTSEDIKHQLIIIMQTLLLLSIAKKTTKKKKKTKKKRVIYLECFYALWMIPSSRSLAYVPVTVQLK